MHLRSFVCLVALSATACGASAPLSYRSGGTRWKMPLVAPLENRELVVAATIRGRGPYLFVVNPDTAGMYIDQGVAESLDLYRRGYRRVWTQDDHTLPRRQYEVPKLVVGDLEIGNVVMTAAPAGSLSFRGQPVAGILGFSFMTSTVLVDVDRDRGELTLELTGHEQLPPGAVSVAGRTHYGTLFVPVVVANRVLKVAVALGARMNALWPSRMDSLPAVPRRFENVDEAGVHRQVHGAVVADLGIDGVRVPGVEFYDLWDRRAREDELDGLLGESFLSRYHVVLDRDHQRLWLAPRDADLGRSASERLQRWGGRFATCAAHGCVELAADGDALRVARDPAVGDAPYEVVLEAADRVGAPLVRVTLGRGVREARVDLHALGARRFRVVDLSPFPTPCAAGGCVATIAR